MSDFLDKVKFFMFGPKCDVCTIRTHHIDYEVDNQTLCWGCYISDTWDKLAKADKKAQDIDCPMCAARGESNPMSYRKTKKHHYCHVCGLEAIADPKTKQVIIHLS